MKRRQLIVVVGGAAAAAVTGTWSLTWPLASLAAAKIARVGIIDNGPDWEPFRAELRELHYAEGQNIAFDYRQADGVPDRLAVAARELVQIPVDVIAVSGTPAAQAAQRATKSIPIVVISVGDPVAAGLVTNFAHPGGNITGNTILGPDIATKRLQLLRDAIPSAARLAFLWNPNNVSSAALLDELWRTTQFFGMSLRPLEARGAYGCRFPSRVCGNVVEPARCRTHDQRRVASDAYGRGHRFPAEEPDSGSVPAETECR
jgi:putative ABC transport system substrate-binding protein